MKSIKEKAEEHLKESNITQYEYKSYIEGAGFGANYVLDAIIECLPKTHSFNPDEVIDIITNRIKELKK